MLSCERARLPREPLESLGRRKDHHVMTYMLGKSRTHQTCSLLLAGKARAMPSGVLLVGRYHVEHLGAMQDEG